MLVFKQKKFLNTSFFLNLFVFAIAYSMSSPVLIEISKKINTSVGNIGYIFSFYFVGFIFGSFLNSLLAKYFKRKKLLIFFNCIITISLFSLFFMVNYVYLAIFFFFIGVSGGFIESQVSVLMTEINKGKEALFVNISQLFFGVGAFIGPLLPVFMIKYGLGWEYSYIAAAALCFINLVVLFFVDISDFDYGINKKGGPIINFTASFKLKYRLFFIILMLMMFFYVCAEIGLVTWIPTFLRLDKHFSEVLAGQVFSLFWFSTIAGRMVTGLLSRKINIAKLLAVIIVLTIIFIFAGIYFSNQLLVIAAFALVGIFIAGIWPLIVSLGGLKFPGKRNFVMSIIILCGGFGGLAAPWLLGFVLDNFNIFFAMNIILLFLFLDLILAIYLNIIDARAKEVLPGDNDD